MCGQITEWIPDQSQHCVKMRILLKDANDWYFTPEMKEELRKAKDEMLSGNMELIPFDPKLETILLTDASKTRGMGFILLKRKANSISKSCPKG